MEVHHHSHHPKKIKEYITEFVMLFVAVSLGFFAENIREMQIEKHREISYLKNVHEDLQLDFKNIDTVFSSNKIRLDVLDSLFLKFNSNTLSNEDIYFYVRNLALRSTFESSRIGFDQIKSAGGLRMIKNKRIISGIQEYEMELDAIAKLEMVREKTLEQARFKLANVFNANILYRMSVAQTKDGILRFPRPAKADDILHQKKEAVNELLNLISIGLNSNRYLNQMLDSLNKIGTGLDQTILEEYEKDMHE